MAKQIKKDKMYSVEAFNANGNPLCLDPSVFAQTPIDAAVIAIKKRGFGISKTRLKSIKNPSIAKNEAIAKVCLLAGARESISYFTVDLS